MPGYALPRTIELADDAPASLISFCEGSGIGRIRVVADTVTWNALGRDAATRAKSGGLDTATTVFASPEPAADAASLQRLLLDDDGDAGRVYVAVGSGTITDIVRFYCHRTGRYFISLPTAPSVDAYASAVSPLIVDGAKSTIAARPPIAIFADVRTLCTAPRPMIAAGFGDMVCKFGAVADWRLGAMLWGEPFDEDIARRTLAAASGCAEMAAEIGEGSERGIRVLMSGLLESGLCMAQAGNSLCASGAEHHYSHFWEMRLLREGRAPVLHGLKVGAATLIVAGIWESIRGLDAAEASRRLALARRPDPERVRDDLSRLFGPAKAEVEAVQSRFLSMDDAGFDGLKRAVADHWPDIRRIADSAPGVDETAGLLASAGCPRDPRELGLSEAEIAAANEGSFYLRDRFTVRRLADLLGIEPPVSIPASRRPGRGSPIDGRARP